MNPRLQTSLAVRWLRHLASTAAGTGLIPGQGIKICIPSGTAKKYGEKKKKKKESPGWWCGEGRGNGEENVG